MVETDFSCVLVQGWGLELGVPEARSFSKFDLSLICR